MARPLRNWAADNDHTIHVPVSPTMPGHCIHGLRVGRNAFAMIQLLRNVIQSGIFDDSCAEHAVRRVLSSQIGIVPSSIAVNDRSIFTLFEQGNGERLIIISRYPRACEGFVGEMFSESRSGRMYHLLDAPLEHVNAVRLREELPQTAPSVLESRESFGTGDRIGGRSSATPGHIEAVAGKGITPVLAQQSVRENHKTGRTFEDVMDDVTWSVFREGKRLTWGADADHLKRIEDVEEAVRAGFTMFTLDPSEKIDTAADILSESDLGRKFNALFSTANAAESFLTRYEGKHGASRLDVVRSGVKYLGAVRHAAEAFHRIADLRGGTGFNFEMSIDETTTETTALDHRIIVTELIREGVSLFSLAPRFEGEFEKGIDYRGSLEGFRRSLTGHYRLSRELGEYRLSLHSGSDKFSVYPVFGEITDGFYHVKTAGTSYLEAVKTTASENIDLFLKILDLSLETFDENAASYHISANPDNVPHSDMLSREEAISQIAGNPDVRQVLHIAFGVVLAAFGDEFRASLLRNRDVYKRFLSEHIGRHVSLLTGR